MGIGGLPNSQAASAPNNHLTSVTVGQPSTAFDSDANGNTITADTTQTYTWDHADRLVAYRVQAGAAPTTEARYLYGAEGLRVKKWVREGSREESTVYLKDACEDHRSPDIPSGKNTLLHVMDGRKQIALIRIGRPHRDDAAPPVQYRLGDHLGSATVVLDAEGSWVSREEYFAYGDTSFGSFAKKRYRFSGKERDEESRLYYFGVRYYHPLLCRWMSAIRCSSGRAGSVCSGMCRAIRCATATRSATGTTRRRDSRSSTHRCSRRGSSAPIARMRRPSRPRRKTIR